MCATASHITSLTIAYSTVFKAQIKENIKAPRHWLWYGDFTGEFPAQRASNAENVSIWWRHRVMRSGLLTYQRLRSSHPRQIQDGQHINIQLLIMYVIEFQFHIALTMIARSHNSNVHKYHKFRLVGLVSDDVWRHILHSLTCCIPTVDNYL